MSLVEHFGDAGAMARAAALRVRDQARRSVEARGTFLLALSGGNTPLPLYDLLASPEFAPQVPWVRTRVFWADERCVPPADPASNASAAQRALLSRVPVPPGQVHRAPVEGVAPAVAAELWEADLRRLLAPDPLFPSFDLVVLGIGADGHTASLFPGDPALEERERWVCAVERPRAEPPLPRVTLTLPVLNNARSVLMLAGRAKAAVTRLMEDDPGEAARRYPAARVRPRGRLEILAADAEGGWRREAMIDAERVAPAEALERVRSGRALLVCAYEDPEKFGAMRLEGAISIQEFRARRGTLPRDQEVIFYCA